MEIVSPANPGSYCERCGRGHEPGPHSGCSDALKLEPPRYCRHCARRMVVQVTPSGWKAECTRHGTREMAARPTAG